MCAHKEFFKLNTFDSSHFIESRPKTFHLQIIHQNHRVHNVCKRPIQTTSLAEMVTRFCKNLFYSGGMSFVGLS